MLAFSLKSLASLLLTSIGSITGYSLPLRRTWRIDQYAFDEVVGFFCVYFFHLMIALKETIKAYFCYRHMLFRTMTLRRLF